MSVVVRKYRTGGWEVDIRFEWPDGTPFRQRKKSPLKSKSGSQRWGEDRERALLAARITPTTERKEVPNLGEFVPRFLQRYAKANRQKPSTISAKESIIRAHLAPLLGEKRLDEISNEDVQRIKARLEGKAAATVNTVLTTLSVVLKTAVEWDVIDNMPCTIRLLRIPQPEAQFYHFDEVERLIEEANAEGGIALPVVLLGCEAGLRLGEMLALEWQDVDFAKTELHIKRSDWRGHVGTPKGGSSRRVGMPQRLREALQAHRNLRSPRVLSRFDGSPVTKSIVQRLMKRLAKRAGLDKSGVHILRHTYCSHLAMRGAHVTAIQRLAGHANLKETQRYMHLSPAAIDSAVALLDKTRPRHGDMLETGIEGTEKRSG